MATKRFRNNAWAYTVGRKSVLPKPAHLTFKDEEEGDLYVAHNNLIALPRIHGNNTSKVQRLFSSSPIRNRCAWSASTCSR